VLGDTGGHDIDKKQQRTGQAIPWMMAWQPMFCTALVEPGAGRRRSW
jgi:hypothetical protein